MDDPLDLRLLLADLKGQIELLAARVEHVHVTLGQKADQMHDTLAAKIENGGLLLEEKLTSSHREMGQMLQFHGEAVIRHQRVLDEHEKRLTNIAETAQMEQQRHDQEDDERFAELFAFRTQVKTAIALLAFVWPALTALLLRWIAP